MDARRMLSIITHGTNVQRPSQVSGSTISINADHAFGINGLNDLQSTNLERRRSSRVSVYCQQKYSMKYSYVLFVFYLIIFFSQSSPI
jgi:hypothetical protein